MTVTRYRDESDVDGCVEALRVMYETSGYPTNWAGRPGPVAPAARRQGVATALLETAMRSAVANDLDLFLDVTDHLEGARALYQRAGFRLMSTTQADWTTPDGGPVTLHRYAWNR